MAINQDIHKAVVIVTTVKNGDQVIFGFTAIADAIYFVTEQVTEEVAKKDAVIDALKDGFENEDGVKYQILDIESYLDLYEDESDEGDEDE